MLFLLKRTVATGLLGLAVLVSLDLFGRSFLPGPLPSLEITPGVAVQGLLILGVVLCSDALIHAACLLVGGQRYRARYREFAAVFRGQTLAALFVGALLAGVGEELCFRGFSTSLVVLLPLAVVFGLLHHLGGRLRWFTLWFVWEGLLFALALGWTGQLAATMLAHFLHDLLGFAIFRWENRSRW